MRTGVTLIDITRAADQLLSEGERPTVDGVRKVLGTGSPATVNNLLKEYYQALPTRLNLPAVIATAAAELYQKIRETAQGEVAEQQEIFQRDLAIDREKLSAERIKRCRASALRPSARRKRRPRKTGFQLWKSPCRTPANC